MIVRLGEMDWWWVMVAIYTGILIVLLLGVSLLRYAWNRGKKHQRKQQQ